MQEIAFSDEARRALFRATVVAAAAGERETSVRRVACAILLTESVVLRCAEVGVSAQVIVNSIDAGYSPLLAKTEEELSRTDVRFGSAAHIASLPFSGWPLSAAVRDALRNYFASEGVAAFTSFDVLLALLRVDADLAAQLRDAGLSEEIFRAR